MGVMARGRVGAFGRAAKVPLEGGVAAVPEGLPLVGGVAVAPKGLPLVGVTRCGVGGCVGV